jgi:hypothetical protein
MMRLTQGNLIHVNGAELETSTGTQPANRAKLVKAVIQRVFSRTEEFRRYGRRTSENANEGQIDFLFATSPDEAGPDDAFARLLWGGSFVYISRNEREVAETAKAFDDRKGFLIDQKPTSFSQGFMGLPIPGLSKKYHYFTARKVRLVMPGKVTDRFTYDVRLMRRSEGDSEYVVMKQIPDYDYVFWRLRERFPDLAMDEVSDRARKLVDRVFPVFLTREAAFLRILQRDLQSPYRERVPALVDMEKDRNGFVRRIYLKWLRNGGKPITQMDFALQAASLLTVLHEQVKIMHLDLRLDNFVITDHGVGFVDFGSAVRMGEDLSQSRMLRSLFNEMMTTSEIQKMLGKMKQQGKITSRVIIDGHQKVDKAVDLFYLALEMNEPHSNPDFRDLVIYDEQSPEAKALVKLTLDILKPQNPENSPYQNASDILAGIKAVAKQFGHEV